MLLLCLALAACRRADVSLPPPTLSPTPRSTPLPPIATEVPVGSEDNPIRMAFVPPESDVEESTIEDFEAALLDATGLTVRLVKVDRPADALAALCASPRGNVTVAWLDGLTTLAALAQTCGTPALSIEHTIGRRSQRTETIQLIGNGDLTDVETLAGRTFCRIDVRDRDTWLLPMLLLQANGVEPSDLDEINDYDDLDALLTAVAEGDCDGAGVPASASADAEDDVRDAITVFDEVEIAFGMSIYPQQLPLGAREALDDALLNFADDDDQVEMLQTLFGADGLTPANEDDLEPLAALIERTGLDLAQIGS